MAFNNLITRIASFFQAIWLFLLGLFGPAPLYKPVIIPPPENPAVLNLEDYRLVWSDEFDGTALNASKWKCIRCSDEHTAVSTCG